MSPFDSKILAELEQNVTSGIFRKDKLENVGQFLSRQGVQVGDYIGHGGHVASFRYRTGQVCKITSKTIHFFKHNQGSTGKDFVDFIIGLDLCDSLLCPTEVIYEDPAWFVYIQPECRPLPGEIHGIDGFTVSSILTILERLLSKGYMLLDLFPKNFGMYRNRVYLYDIQELKQFDQKWLDSPRTLLGPRIIVTEMCRSALGLSPLVPPGHVIHNLDLAKFVEKQSGREGMSQDMKNHLEQFLSRFSVEFLPGLISCFGKESGLEQELTDYQYGTVSCRGELTLSGSTLEKYSLACKARDLLKNGSNCTFIDAGCCFGLIGVRLALDCPDSRGTLCNITGNEIRGTTELVVKLHVENVTVLEENILSLTARQWDLTLYFALVHHLLRVGSFQNIMGIIRSQTRQICLVEIPFGSDVLLKRVKASVPPEDLWRYDVLDTEESVSAAILDSGFEIMETVDMNYGKSSSDLRRKAWILKAPTF